MPRSPASITRCAQAVEVGLVELAEVKLGFAIRRQAGTGASVGHRVEIDLFVRPRTPFRVIPCPQPQEVVAVML